MKNSQHLKNFVQDVLGCTCPEKVFEEIEERRVLPADSPHNRSITIGGRLLIYIWEVRETEQFNRNFCAMLAAGRRERDQKGLNRFRAVLAVDPPYEDIAGRAALCFAGFCGRDERIHFHVVSSRTIQNL